MLKRAGRKEGQKEGQKEGGGRARWREEGRAVFYDDSEGRW